MSTPEAARRKMLKPNGFVHRARAWALRANVICRGGDFFSAGGQCLRMSSRAQKMLLPRVLFKRVPLLTSACVDLCSAFTRIHNLLVTRRPSDSSISLKSF